MLVIQVYVCVAPSKVSRTGIKRGLRLSLCRVVKQHARTAMIGRWSEKFTSRSRMLKVIVLDGSDVTKYSIQLMLFKDSLTLAGHRKKRITSH